MPYINPEIRRFLEPRSVDPALNPGALAFQIMDLVLEYTREHSEPSYALYAEIIGVLEATKLEFVRRVVNPYEDKKIQENGDVF